MKNSILTSTISKLDLQGENKNLARAETALNDICNTLEMCYKERYKKTTEHQEEKADEVAKLIESLKDEINFKLKEISTSDDKNKREILVNFIEKFIVNKRKNIKSGESEYSEIEKYSKLKLRSDLGEMLVLIRGYSNIKKQEEDEKNAEIVETMFYEVKPQTDVQDTKFHRMQLPDLENPIYPDAIMGDDNYKGGDER